jgi:DNA-binding MarR family transcriptional regulator
MSTTAAAKLSKAQRAILEDLLCYLQTQPAGQWRPAPGCSPPIPLRELRGRRSRRGAWGKTRADSAAYSRALRRLEARGLVLRTNVMSGRPDTGHVRTAADQPHGRSDHVFLTDLGRQVAGQIQNG